MSTEDPLVEAVYQRVIAHLQAQGYAQRDLIPIGEAAARLNLHHMSVRQWIRDGRLPVTRLGSRVFITQGDFARLLTGELPSKKGSK